MTAHAKTLQFLLPFHQTTIVETINTYNTAAVAAIVCYSSFRSGANRGPRPLDVRVGGGR